MSDPDKYYLMAVKEWISVAPDEEVKDVMENPDNPYVSITEREKFLKAISILRYGEEKGE